MQFARINSLLFSIWKNRMPPSRHSNRSCVCVCVCEHPLMLGSWLWRSSAINYKRPQCIEYASNAKTLCQPQTTNVRPLDWSRVETIHVSCLSPALLQFYFQPIMCNASLCVCVRLGRSCGGVLKRISRPIIWSCYKFSAGIISIISPIDRIYSLAVDTIGIQKMTD